MNIFINSDQAFVMGRMIFIIKFILKAFLFQFKRAGSPKIFSFTCM